MPRTIVIDTVVVGTKPGFRIEVHPVFTKRRYDIHNGKLDYLYSETRTHATVFHNRIPVDLVLVHLDDRHNVAFDVRTMPPPEGQRVKLLEHRIGGTKVHDLYDPRFSMIVDEGEFPLTSPTIRVPLVVAVVTALCLTWHGLEQTEAAGYAIAAGASIFGLSLTRHHYVDKGLRILRWKAERRLRTGRDRAVRRIPPGSA